MPGGGRYCGRDGAARCSFQLVTQSQGDAELHAFGLSPFLHPPPQPRLSDPFH